MMRRYKPIYEIPPIEIEETTLANLHVDIGRRLRELREKRGYSQETLAELSNLSTNFLAGLEHGRSQMTTTSLYRVVLALGTSADYLVFGVEHPPVPPSLEHLLGYLSAEDRKSAEEILLHFVKVANR